MGAQCDETMTAAKSRKFVWDKPTRTVMGSIIAEASMHTAKMMAAEFGIKDAATHAKQHEIYEAFIPFIQSLKSKADSQAEFFDSLNRILRSQAARVASFAFWVLLAAIPFGLFGGFNFVKSYVGF